MSERIGGVRAFIGIEAEIEQQRQHLGTIEAYRECHEPADVAHGVGDASLRMARAKPVAVVHRHRPERSPFGAMPQEQIAQLLEAIVRVSCWPAAEHVDRREPVSRWPVDIRTVRQRPGGDLRHEAGGRQVQQRGAVGTVVDELRMLAQQRTRFQEGDHRSLVATTERVHEFRRRRWHVRRCVAAVDVAARRLGLLDDGDDVVVAALGGNRQWRRRHAMRIDPDARVGAVRHQQADHRRVAREHGMVQRAMLVALGDVHVDDLGTRLQQGLDAGRIAGTDRLDEARHGGAVDEGLQFRPALESVGAGQHELRVVQRERGRVRSAIVRGDLGDCVGIALAECREQFLGLPLQLMEVWTVGKRAGRRMGGHDELLPAGH